MSFTYYRNYGGEDVIHVSDLTICPLFNFELIGEGGQELELSDQIKIRRIKSDELENIKKNPLMFTLGNFTGLLNSKTFVFEIKVDNQEEEDLLVYEALLAMRLLKAGSVCCKLFLHLENSKLIYFFSINAPIPRWVRNDYVLHNYEFDEIKKLWDRILQIELRTNKSFRVACERFSRSYEERKPDDKIIDLAIAFESLFTDENTSRNRSYGMGQFVGLGCSMLIGQNREERNEIKEFLRKAFKIRNNIVHGLAVEIPMINKKKPSMDDVSSKLQEYLRASIKKLI